MITGPAFIPGKSPNNSLGKIKKGFTVFVNIGIITAELIIRADDFLIAEQMRLEPGGRANLLILLSRLGAAAAALGTLGEDLWGEQVFQVLENEGVDVSLIRREGTTTVALVLVARTGRESRSPSVLGSGKRRPEPRPCSPPATACPKRGCGI